MCTCRAACTHHTVCLAVHVMHVYLCSHVHVQVHVCHVLACQQACPCLPVGVHALRARAEPRCAGMLRLWPWGAALPSTIQSLGMLQLASCRHLCSVPASHREGVGSRLAQFVLIITQVVTKSGMSYRLSREGACPEHIHMYNAAARHQGCGPLVGRVHTALGCTRKGEHKHYTPVTVTPTSQPQWVCLTS